MAEPLIPRLELVPIRPAVCADAGTTLDVLVRVVPPPPPEPRPGERARPPLNLALVLDRSGSMAGADKMPYAIEAAIFAVRQLGPADRLTVTLFDDEVTTLVPAAPVTDPEAIVRQLRGIAPRGATDLLAGWADGAREVGRHRRSGALNRVLLLTDGQTNRGVVESEVIADAARDAAAGGVSTSCLGLGRDYNESLLEAMADAGDGNYYFLESPVGLPDLFATELQGLMATVGQKVSLGVTAGGGGRVLEVLNDLPTLATGRLALPPLVVGSSVPVVVRLKLPVWPGPDAGPVATFRLAWNPSGDRPRQTLLARLDLPAVPEAAWNELPADPTVADAVARLEVGRAERSVAESLRRGDVASAHLGVRQAEAILARGPVSPASLDREGLERLKHLMSEGDLTTSAKQAAFLSYRKRRGQGAPPGPGPSEPGSPPPA